MHMGPDDPLFAGRAGRGRPGRSGALPPGARYDPIGPPGMPVRNISSKAAVAGIALLSDILAAWLAWTMKCDPVMRVDGLIHRHRQGLR